MNESIRYIKRGEIDTTKWDHCINNASNGLIYAYSVYLDKMASNWDALVSGDYDFVMPLAWRKKASIYYCYQPAFTASLGIFGKVVSPEITEQFLRAIPQKFQLVDICLNFGNLLPVNPKNYSIRTNYLLPLHKPYEEMAAGYRENTKRNIRKAVQLDCSYSNNIPVEEVIAISKAQLQSSFGNSDNDYNNFRALYYSLQAQEKAITRAILSARGEILASCVFFFSHNRAFYILVGNQPNGRTLGASHYMIDQFIKENTGSGLLLDFEGSDIRNLAFFYSSFGATEEYYPALKINKLSWWIKLISGKW